MGKIILNRIPGLVSDDTVRSQPMTLLEFLNSVFCLFSELPISAILRKGITEGDQVILQDTDIQSRITFSKRRMLVHRVITVQTFRDRPMRPFLIPSQEVLNPI